MKTKCYCVYCPKHPLFEKRNELPVLTGWRVGGMILEKKYLEQGRDVDCLEPESDAFDELFVDPDDFEYPITAYDDGYAATGTRGSNFTIEAFCANEEYKE